MWVWQVGLKILVCKDPNFSSRYAEYLPACDSSKLSVAVFNVIDLEAMGSMSRCGGNFPVAKLM